MNQVMTHKIRSARAQQALCVTAFVTLRSVSAVAQEQEGGAIPEVVVTGSRILRTDTETPSPLQTITADDLKQSGYTSTQEVLTQLTANGQGTLSQSFSGAFASGAAGIALRGLNVGYTLTLINGHRMAPYPIGDDGQRSFVDIANIPFDAIERIEVLKDGASAEYGSDAIAGVVNIILKKSYQGASITADAGTSRYWDGNTYHGALIVGAGDLANDGHNAYISAEFRTQNQIRFVDRGGYFTQRDFTSQGGINVTPGAPNILNGGLAHSGTGYVLDPNSTTGLPTGFMPGCTLAFYQASQCTYQDTWNQIQPYTTNYNIVGRFTQNFAQDWQASFDGSFFESKSQQVSRAQYSRTFTSGFTGVASGPGVTPYVLPPVGPTMIPPTNPSFPAGLVIPPGPGNPTGAGILYYTFVAPSPEITDSDSKSYRAVLELTGKIGTWDLDFAAGYTEVDLDLTGIGYINASNLQAALDSTTNPYIVAGHNTPTVLNFVSPELTTTDTSKLAFGHAGLTNSNLLTLPGGSLGLAVGADYFDRKQHTIAPEQVAAGFISDFSNNFTVGTQQVASGYAEFDATMFKQLEINLAGRYDHYNLSGGQFSPKVGLKWKPIEQFALRGTAAKGFRAPGPAENGQAGQTFFAASTNDPILCPNPGSPTSYPNFANECVVNLPGQQVTNANLKAETSKSYTAGFIFEPVSFFSTTFDWYHIKIDDQIVSGGPQITVRSTSLAPLLQYQPVGPPKLVTPPVGPIAFNAISFINANTTETDGFDLSFDFHHRWDNGWQFRSDAVWTYINKFDITIDGTTYQLAGTHGPFFFSGDTGNPKSRVRWENTFAKGRWSATITMNYISAFKVTDPSSIAFAGVPQDTCLEALTNGGGAASLNFANQLAAGNVPSNSMCTVNHFTTWDLYGRFDATDKLSFHGSVTNLFNAKAPLDWATYGGALGEVPWNPSLHYSGAVGTYFTLGVTYTF